jgi:hypothetical protein
MAWLLLVLIFLVVYRGTRLITRDNLPLISIPREAFVQRWGAFQDAARIPDDRRRNWLVRGFRYVFAGQWPSINGLTRTNLVMKSLAYLIECDWCTSVWVGAAVVYTSAQYVDLPYPWLVWGAASAVTGLLVNVEEKLDK